MDWSQLIQQIFIAPDPRCIYDYDLVQDLLYFGHPLLTHDLLTTCCSRLYGVMLLSLYVNSRLATAEGLHYIFNNSQHHELKAKVLSHPQCPRELLVANIKPSSYAPYTGYCLANPGCPQELLYQCNVQQYALSLAANPNCPLDLLQKIALNVNAALPSRLKTMRNRRLREKLLANSQFLPILLQEGLPHKPEDRLFLAENPALPASFLASWYADLNLMVDQQLASLILRHPSCPLVCAMDALTSGNEYAIAAALANLKLSAKGVLLAANAKSARLRWCAMLHPNAPPYVTHLG